MSFEKLNLIEPILKALNKEGYTTPTPIQQRAIPVILERRDLIGCAQTGTGKTAAFAIPILQLLHQELNSATPQDARSTQRRKIKALIVTPTRELAIQIGESFAAYGVFTGLQHTVIFGGVAQGPQTSALRRGIEILIATPGRLLDLMGQQFIDLREISFFVLDEADRMLDMGFIMDVKKIMAVLPKKRQSLLFSATMPPAIVNLAASLLINPTKVEVAPVKKTTDAITQSVYFVDKGDKKNLLLHLLEDKKMVTALVFTRTKHGADHVAKILNKQGIKSEAIHGNKSQQARQRALENFKNKETRVLVATDLAARGLDIEELTHVVNYEIPNIPETYVHRIGRTGRAGATGIAVSFCDADEKAFLRDIHKLISKEIPTVNDHPFPMSNESPVMKAILPKQNFARNQGNSGTRRFAPAEVNERRKYQTSWAKNR